MTIANCLINSKIGDVINYGSALRGNGAVIKKDYIQPRRIYPAGFYPKVWNSYGDLILIHPTNYKVNKIIRCQ